MLKFSKEVETELRSSVIQAVEVSPGKYGEMPCAKFINLKIPSTIFFVAEAKIRSETVKLDNVPFKEICDVKKEKT